MLVVLLGFVAFAVDIGYVMVVRNDLPKCRGAGALAGSGLLYPNTPPTNPNWTAAQTEATAVTGLNKSSGTTLTDCQVQTGYWNLQEPRFGLQDNGHHPGSHDAPAVR